MAYLIRLNNDVVKIAANDTDKNEHNVSYDIYSTIDISDSNFTKLKKNTATVSISGDTATFTDESDRGFASEAQCKNYVDGIKTILKDFLDQTSNNTKSIYSTAQTYYNTLNSFDFSTITFPSDKSWEEYCEDNSITYLHPLQIP